MTSSLANIFVETLMNCFQIFVTPFSQMSKSFLRLGNNRGMWRHDDVSVSMARSVIGWCCQRADYHKEFRNRECSRTTDRLALACDSMNRQSSHQSSHRSAASDIRRVRWKCHPMVTECHLVENTRRFLRMVTKVTQGNAGNAKHFSCREEP